MEDIGTLIASQFFVRILQLFHKVVIIESFKISEESFNNICEKLPSIFPELVW